MPQMRYRATIQARPNKNARDRKVVFSMVSLTPLDIEYRLFLGRLTRDARVVSHFDFAQFVDAEIIPRFDGFTVYDAQGFWKGQSERTTVVEILASPLDATKVRDIAKAYAARFDQESVLIRETTGNTLVVDTLLRSAAGS